MSLTEQSKKLAQSINLDGLTADELKAVYEISRVILKAENIASALREIVRLARPVFIFDNVVLYRLKTDQSLEPTYARSVGRGRSVEADMAWGEAIALEVIDRGQRVIRKEEVGSPTGDRMWDRLRLRDFLGLPLFLHENLRAVLVFIRFGGPKYELEQIRFAELIAENVVHLLERTIMSDQIGKLEAERQLARMQEDFVATVSHDLRSPLGFIKGYATSLLRDDAQWVILVIHHHNGVHICVAHDPYDFGHTGLWSAGDDAFVHQLAHFLICHRFLPGSGKRSLCRREWLCLLSPELYHKPAMSAKSLSAWAASF